MVRTDTYACVWLCMHVCTGGLVKMTNYGYTCTCMWWGVRLKGELTVGYIG